MKGNETETTDYQSEYDKYWVDATRIGSTSTRLDRIAELVVATCGGGRMLDVGSGEGVLVAELLKLGVDAHGFDVSEVAVDRSNTRATGRFVRSSALSLPYPDEHFDCIVSTDCLEHISPKDVPIAIAELHRVCRRYMFMQIAIVPDRDGHWHLTVEDRAWWEHRFFEAGFRKHPGYYGINGYAALNKDDWQIFILLEKMPRDVAQAVGIEQDRATGIASDAYLYKYEWAAGFVRPGDRVCDMEPGTGAGAYLLAHRSEASQVLCSVDAANQAYFKSAYGVVEPRLVAGAPDSALEANSCDFAIHFGVGNSFSKVTHLATLLNGRITPGGRLLLSVTPCDVVESSGWKKLAESAVPAGWYLEKVYFQQGTIPVGDVAPMRLIVDGDQVDEHLSLEGSELLLVLMKDQTGAEAVGYRESVYGANDKPSDVLEFARDYRNPWLLRALVEFPFRARNPLVLATIADMVLADAENRRLPDEAAALAVKGYQLLERNLVFSTEVDELLERINDFWAGPIDPEHAPGSAHAQRWRISLGYLKGCLLRKIGRLDEALLAFDTILVMDWRGFSPTIGTKVVDAAYDAGQILVSQGKLEEARERWKQGVIGAYDMLGCGVPAFIGDIEDPQQFAIVVAVELLDSASRCVKALRWSAKSRSLPNVRWFEQSRQCWKWMIKERSQAIVDTEVRVQDRDAVIADQDRRLAERWDVLQKLDAMVKDRDATIGTQAVMLEDRWKVMEQQDALVRERDATIAAQSRQLEERWAAMQQQDALVRERDATIAMLDGLLSEHQAAMTGLEGNVRARDEEVTVLRRQLEATIGRRLKMMWKRLKGP